MIWYCVVCGIPALKSAGPIYEHMHLNPKYNFKGGSHLGYFPVLGNKRIVHFNASAGGGGVKSRGGHGVRLVLEVTSAKAQPVIRSFAAFYNCPIG